MTNPPKEINWDYLDELVETLEALRTWAHGRGIDTRKLKPLTVMVELPRGEVEWYAKHATSFILQEACAQALENEE